MQVERTERRPEGLEGAEHEKSWEVSEGREGFGQVSGGRVSNTWATCPKVGNNCSKGRLIPHKVPWRRLW